MTLHSASVLDRAPTVYFLLLYAYFNYPRYELNRSYTIEKRKNQNIMVLF